MKYTASYIVMFNLFISYKQVKHNNLRCGEFPNPNLKTVEYGKHSRVGYLGLIIVGKNKSEYS